MFPLGKLLLPLIIGVNDAMSMYLLVEESQRCAHGCCDCMTKIRNDIFPFYGIGLSCVFCKYAAGIVYFTPFCLFSYATMGMITNTNIFYAPIIFS